MRSVVRVEDPAVLPVPVEDALAHCRVMDGEDGGLMEFYLRAAVEHMDGPRGILGRCLMRQTWLATYDVWCAELRLPVPDVTAVEVRYFDSAGSEITLGADAYDIVNRPGASTLRFRSTFASPVLGPEVGGITVRATAGAETPEGVPAGLRAAILIHVAHLYENREAVSVGGAASVVPMAYDALVTPWRVML